MPINKTRTMIPRMTNKVTIDPPHVEMDRGITEFEPFFQAWSPMGKARGTSMFFGGIRRSIPSYAQGFGGLSSSHSSTAIGRGLLRRRIKLNPLTLRPQGYGLPSAPRRSMNRNGKRWRGLEERRIIRKEFP
jgi:hypothetical protein